MMARIFPKRDIVNAGDRELEEGFDGDSATSKGFYCTICQGIPRVPYQLKRCGHIFCRLCITQYSGDQRICHCPNCRHKYSLIMTKEFIQMSRVMKAHFRSLSVLCPNKCGFNGNPGRVDHHQKHESSTHARVSECELSRSAASLHDDRTSLHKLQRVSNVLCLLSDANPRQRVDYSQMQRGTARNGHPWDTRRTNESTLQG